MPVKFDAYMLRDKTTGRWHNYGGLTEWLPDSEKGGSIWTDKEAAQKFADEYNKAFPSHRCFVEVVPLLIQENHDYADRGFG